MGAYEDRARVLDLLPDLFRVSCQDFEMFRCDGVDELESVLERRDHNGGAMLLEHFTDRGRARQQSKLTIELAQRRFGELEGTS